MRSALSLPRRALTDLSRYAVKARPPADLLLGFAALDPAAIDAGAAALARVIAETESMR